MKSCTSRECAIPGLAEADFCMSGRDNYWPPQSKFIFGHGWSKWGACPGLEYQFLGPEWRRECVGEDTISTSVVRTQANRTSYTVHMLCMIVDIDSFSVGDEAKRTEFMALLKTYPQDSMSKEWVIVMVVTCPTLYIHLWHTAYVDQRDHQGYKSLQVGIQLVSLWWGLMSTY